MFDFTRTQWPVPDEIVAALRSTWDAIGGPGALFTGSERVAIAAATREAKLGIAAGVAAPDGTTETISVMSANPATTTQEWVDAQAADLGGPTYIETVGVVSQLIAVDTFTRLLGMDPEPLPEPRAGEPSGEVNRDLKRGGKTWFPAGEFPSPPYLLAMVPSEPINQNVISDVLYMPGEEMVHSDWERNDLHRTQMEVVAASTSHVNECFF
ncbi:MAG: hypothetical protein HKN46_03240 [Acidimicrobiia bacterium]|nr:hypothetical protein [Acidimicrobiia bacterium]